MNRQEKKSKPKREAPSPPPTVRSTPLPVPAFTQVAIEAIEGARWNAPNRVRDAQLERLRKDIAVYGVASPLSVVDGGQGRFLLGDGHRRLAACKSLRKAGDPRFSTLPCLVYPSNGNGREPLLPEHLFLRQFATRKPSGNELLRVFLANPAAVPSKEAAFLGSWLALVGRDLMVRVSEGRNASSPGADDGFPAASIEAFRIAKRLASKVKKTLDPSNEEDRAFADRLIRWLCIGANRLGANQHMNRTELDQSRLLKHIQDGTRVVLDFGGNAAPQKCRLD